MIGALPLRLRRTSRPGGRVGCRHREGPVSRRGKSGLHRARWWVTPTRGDPRESATESRPPRRAGTRGGARVKGCGKSAPAPGVTRAARQTPPGARSRGRSGRAACAGVRGLPARACGWTAGGCRQRQPERDGRRRGLPRGPCHRTRLTGRLVRRLAATPPPRVAAACTERSVAGPWLGGNSRVRDRWTGCLTGSDGMTSWPATPTGPAYAQAVALASARSRVAGQWVDLGIGPVVPAPAARAVNTRGRWHARVAHPVALAQPAVQAELANHHKSPSVHSLPSWARQRRLGGPGEVDQGGDEQLHRRFPLYPVPAASRHCGPRLVPDICERSAQFRPTCSPPLGCHPRRGRAGGRRACPADRYAGGR